MSLINTKENEIFSGLYDEIFLQEIKGIKSTNKIISFTKKYLDSNAPVSEKKYFLKLRNQYWKIQNIKDYENIQKQLYDGKSRNEIIYFELARIMNTNNLPMRIYDQVSDVEKLLDVYKGSELTEELYEKIVNLILKMEISQGMKIGLFNELCTLFLDEMERLEKKMVVDTVTYSKKK